LKWPAKKEKIGNGLQPREGGSGEGRELEDEEKKSKRSGWPLWGSKSGGDGEVRWGGAACLFVFCHGWGL